MKKHFLKDNLIEECRGLYNKHGVRALLYKNIDKKLYYKLYYNGIRLSEVISQLGLESEFNKFKKDEARWNWNKIINKIRHLSYR